MSRRFDVPRLRKELVVTRKDQAHLDALWAEKGPAAYAKAYRIPIEQARQELHVGRGAPGVPRGPKPDAVKIKTARSVSKAVREKEVAARADRREKLHFIERMPRKDRPKMALAWLTGCVVMDHLAARYEEAWAVPPGSLRARVAEKIVPAADVPDEVLAALEAAEQKRKAAAKKIAAEIAAAIADPGEFTDRINARFAVERSPAPKPTGKAETIRVPQGVVPDGRRRAPMTESGGR